MRTYSRTLALAGVSLSLFLGAALGRPQDPLKPSSDDALDNLLKKVEQAESGKPAEKPASPKTGEVAPKDQALDSLLEKLGASKDEPSKEAEPPPGEAGGEPDSQEKASPKSKSGTPPKSKSDQAKPKDLTGETKKLDEHLEELTGRRRRQDRQKQQSRQEGGQGEQSGPLDDLVKEMRDVEERLSKPDTGEQTRQKQGEIVKRLDTMIDAMKKASSRQQAMRQMRQGRQPGRQQGDPQGAQANGPPPTRPERPKGKSVVALDKNTWGNLPPDVRAELENVFTEEPLPSKDDLIKRYYLSVSRKSMAREE